MPDLQSKPNLSIRLRAGMQGYILRGLIVVVPLGITAYAMILCYQLTAKNLTPLIHALGYDFPDLAIALLSVMLFLAILFLLGVVATAAAGKRLIALLELILEHIPMVKTIYGASKQVVELFAPKDAGPNYQAAVVVDFPYQGAKSIAFATGQIRLNDGPPLLKAFVPTTPNPTSGYLEFYPLDTVQVSSLSVEDAVKSVMSAGILLPDHMELAALGDFGAINERDPQPERQAEPAPKISWVVRFKNILRNRLLSGLLIIIPLVITSLVVQFIFSLTVGRILPVVERFLGAMAGWMVVAVSLVIFLVGLYFIGVLATFVVGKQLIRLGEFFIDRIPLAATVYSASKQMVESLTLESAGANLKSPVIIDFPFPGAKAMGFLVGMTRDSDGRDFCRVYLPTTPNITVGILLLYPPESVTICDLPVEDAIKTIVSAGILAPKSITTRPWSQETGG